MKPGPTNESVMIRISHFPASNVRNLVLGWLWGIGFTSGVCTVIAFCLVAMRIHDGVVGRSL